MAAHNKIYRSPGNPWNDMQLIQHWDKGNQKDFFMEQRKQQLAFERVVPLVNEEYGYQDLWEKNPGDRNAESRRRTAWEVYMAGGYQTTGETALWGTGFDPDSGGGWVNGRGDDTMTMLPGYVHIVDFFTSFDWWQTKPCDELVTPPATCLADPGKLYAIYLPDCKPVTINLEPGTYRVRLFNPRRGEWIELPDVTGPQWTSPIPPDDGDWALLLTDYDWRGSGAFDKHKWNGFLLANNRWGGGNGRIWFRDHGDHWAFWTEHSDNMNGGHVKSFPHAGIGWFWGDWASNDCLPIRLSELAVAKSDWTVILPEKEPGQSYVVYYQLYTSPVPDPKSDASKITGDLALIIHREDFPFEAWGKVVGEFPVDSRKTRVVHKSPAIGHSTYIIMIPTSNTAERDGNILSVKDFDIKSYIDFCVSHGFYKPDEYLITIQVGWESRVLHGIRVLSRLLG